MDMEDRIYRLVADYGWGDKAWSKRGMTANEAVMALNKEIGGDFTTIEEALNYDGYIYTIEEDAWGDVEDWDWMDS